MSETKSNKEGVTVRQEEKVKRRYPQDEPPGSETFPAVGQSSDLLLTGRTGGQREDTVTKRQ